MYSGLLHRYSSTVTQRLYCDDCNAAEIQEMRMVQYVGHFSTVLVVRLVGRIANTNNIGTMPTTSSNHPLHYLTDDENITR